MKCIKKSIALLIVAFLFIFNAGASVKGYEVDKCIPAKDKEIVEMMDKYINEASKQYCFSGSILVAKDGKIIFNKGYGKANYEKNISNEIDTKFTLASITKQFVAAGIMILQDKNKLNVKDSINKYITNYPNGDNITIHQLLTHTSGIADYFTDSFVLSKESKIPYNIDEIIALFKDKPVNFEPGKTFGYSNSNYVLLGKIIENVSGMKCEKFLEDNIFKPLEMKNSGFYLDKKNLNNSAEGYKRTETGVEKCLNTANEYLDLSSVSMAGGMYSTCYDLYLWDKALNEGKLLSKESLDKIYTPYTEQFSYGYGVSIENLHGKKCVSHSGGMSGVETYIYRYINDNTCIILLANLPGSGLSQIEKNLFSILYEGKYEQPTPFNEISLSSNVLDNYIGKYEFMPGLEYEVTRENEKLYVQEVGSVKNRIYPYSQSEFYYKTVNQQARFEEIQDGKAKIMVLKFGDSEYKLKRIN